MLASDVVVAQPERLPGCELETHLGERGERQLLRTWSGRREHRRVELGAQVVDFDIERRQYLEGEIAAFVEKAEQEVLRTEVVVRLVVGDFLREHDRVARPRSE